ncbi:MAG: LuxR C-terminal-related transcriptional regulator [Myxococcales bacterium]
MAAETFVGAVELAYSKQDSDALWLRQVIEQLTPVMHAGLGVFGWFYDAQDLSDVKFMHPTLLDTPSGALEALHGTLTSEHRVESFISEHYATPAGTVSSQLRESFATYRPLRDTLGPLGIRDIVTINGFDVDGRGIAINAFLPEPTTLPPQRLSQLQHMAAHLISSSRLRRLTDVREAVLDTDGKVQDATGEAKEPAAREALSLAARAVEAARGRLRRAEPAQALETWRALVDGRWSVVDFIDTDGKRFLVARVNEPAPSANARGLTKREHQIAALVGRGHSNKLIAYDLGLGEGTVASYLRRVIEKLGVSSRGEVIQLFAATESAHASKAGPS